MMDGRLALQSEQNRRTGGVSRTWIFILGPFVYLLSLGPAAALHSHRSTGPFLRQVIDWYFLPYNLSPLDSNHFSWLSQPYLNMWI